MVVGEDFEFSVEVEGQEDETRECCGRVAARHGFEAVVDLGFVAGADAFVVHNLAETVSAGDEAVFWGWDVGLADCKEIWS